MSLARLTLLRESWTLVRRGRGFPLNHPASTCWPPEFCKRILHMPNPLPMRATVATLDDDAWEDLLNFIEERRVIPIIGPELLQVETETGHRLLYDWESEKLAVLLNVDTTAPPQPYTMNDVVCWFLASRGRREEAYTRVRSIFRDANFVPPLALRQLAQITDFDLFVTTTFDPLLEQAINLERFQGAQSAEVIAYAPNRVIDLPNEKEKLQRPVVYHLLGRLSASPTYVISDEDTLEFICALQSEHLTPERLFHELEHNHLLFIGSSFTNWLARLFLRMAKRHRLSDPRDVGEVLADYHCKIQRNIARCSYFVPVVSATTQRRLEGYFRREWSYAIDRTRNIAEGALFILPVCIDETDVAAAHVPDKFKALNFTRLPGGEVSPEFKRRLQDFLSARHG